MNKDGVILIAEQNDGHYSLIKNSLIRAGLENEILRFADGCQILDFLFKNNMGKAADPETRYILILDISLPGINGIEVLNKIKQDEQLKMLPVIVFTAVDVPATIEKCHELGCSVYLIKPVEEEAFSDAVNKMGLFLSVVEVPPIGNRLAGEASL